MLNIASIEIYCELSLIFAILRNFRVAGANNIVFCYPIGQKKLNIQTELQCVVVGRGWMG